MGALANIIVGSSTCDDASYIASLYQLALASLGARLWFEYVESAANLADVPTRELQGDEALKAELSWLHPQGVDVTHVPLPDLSHCLMGPPFAELLDSLQVLQPNSTPNA